MQPFVGPLFWLLMAGLVAGVGYPATAAIVGLLEFSGPASQRARFWIATAGPGTAVLGYLMFMALVLLT